MIEKLLQLHARLVDDRSAAIVRVISAKEVERTPEGEAWLRDCGRYYRIRKHLMQNVGMTRFAIDFAIETRFGVADPVRFTSRATDPHELAGGA